MYKSYYESPIGLMTLVSDGDALIGVWIEGQKYFAATMDENTVEKNDLEIYIKTRSWLDRYFAGDKPSHDELSLAPKGSLFRQGIWKILLGIPYGETIAYGEIAVRIAKQSGILRMSAQAVGGAVGHNPISIIIPCHRVIGSKGQLTGFASGLTKKEWLLRHEGAEIMG